MFEHMPFAKSGFKKIGTLKNANMLDKKGGAFFENRHVGVKKAQKCRFAAYAFPGFSSVSMCHTT